MKTILVVEDDVSLGQTLSERLQKVGHKSFLAPDLAHAWELFSNNTIDLIVLDVGLPDGTGFDFAERVNKAKLTPIVFVTAQSGADDRLRGFELGAQEFLPKPFHLKEFLCAK